MPSGPLLVLDPTGLPAKQQNAVWVGAIMSLFMNNAAAASALLPAARKAEVRLPRLLMPLAFGTLPGGTATLFTTANIVVRSVLRDSGYPGFGVLDFAPVGLPLIVVGIGHMVLWGRRMLPTEVSSQRAEAIGEAEGGLLHLYNPGDRIFRARIPEGSYLTNRRLVEGRSARSTG